ncbi:MAG: hypothetical protein U9R50_13090 [Campylobacterota bacterium]|nr:hypothetical protein [Campylobacterota bacterium]
MKLLELEDLRDKSILLLGKTRALNPQEFEKLLGIYNITCKTQMDESIVLVIEGRMMSPYHQNEQEHLYEKGCSFESIDRLEEALCRSINPDTLMMSLKLSNNQERLQSFIQNPYIDNNFFLKLMSLYDWKGESFFDTNENRDVTAALIRRFYKDIERNHNVEYANTGLAHLLTQTTDSELVTLIASLAPLQNAMKKGSDSATHKILQRIALHPFTLDSVLLKMIRHGNSALLALIASREPLSKTLQDKLIASQEEIILKALSCNKTLEYDYVKQLLDDEAYRKNILSTVSLNDVIFEQYHLTHATVLAQNPSLHVRMMQKLFDMNNKEVMYVLASNSSLSEEICDALMTFSDEKLLQILIENPQLSSEQLHTFIDNSALHVSLASNEKCDGALLEVLSHSSDPELILALAKNPSTPIDILFQLQLDARYERAVHENSSFAKHIQTQNLGWL